MPWQRNADLPSSVRQVLPAGAQTRFREVANDRMSAGDDEDAAIRQAWSVVRQGWEKPSGGGTWVRKVARTLFARRPLLNAAEFAAWAKSQGFETTLPPESLHVTLAHSKESLDWPAPHMGQVVVGLPAVRSVERLGDGGAVVLRFEAPVLERRWRELLAAGASWDFDDYSPHVTITWDAPDMDLSQVEPFRGDLVFGPEMFDEVDDSWRDTVSEKQFLKADVCKVEEELGLVLGWAIVSKVDGQSYFDTQGDHIPEDSMLEAATDFMLSGRVVKEMHSGGQKGTVVFAWPMTVAIAKSMGISTSKTGLMIAMKPSSDEMLEKFRSGEYTGFSVGGQRIRDEEVA